MVRGSIRAASLSAPPGAICQISAAETRQLVGFCRPARIKGIARITRIDNDDNDCCHPEDKGRRYARRLSTSRPFTSSNFRAV